MKISEISLENRPRERLEKNGASSLSDAELLAIILQNGSQEENAMDLSNRIVSKFTLNNLSNCSLKELQSIKEIGKAKACQILAVFELNKRYSSLKSDNNNITSAKDVYNYFFPKVCNLDKEHVFVLHLDSKNKIIRDYLVSIGILNEGILHSREIFKSAIKDSCNSIIIVHNHPSGDPTPSKEDLNATEKLIASGEILGIKVLDHVIIGNGKYWSWNDDR